MSLRVVCTGLVRAFFNRAGSLPLLRSISTSAYLAQKVDTIIQEVFRDDIMPEKMTFDEFARRYIKSFEEYSQRPVIKELYKNAADEEIKKAYESYCSSMLTKYRYFIEGGDPGTML